MNEDRDSAAAAPRGSTSFETLAAGSSDPLALLDRSGRVLRADRRALRLLGRPAADLEGEPAETLLETRDRFAFRKALSVFAPNRPPPDPSRQPIRVRADVPRPGGDPVPVEFGLRSHPDGEDVVVLSLRDVTGRDRSGTTRDRTGERDRLLFEHNVAGVFRISLEGRILEVNRAFAEIFGYEEPADLEGADAGELYADPRARSRFRERLRKTGSVHNYELECRRRDGTSIWLLENSLLVGDSETGRDVVVGTVIDISRRKRLEQELERMAYHDSLTGLPNRRLLREQAGQVVALAERGDHRVGLVYLDMARFKQVNDTFGHDAGDEVLREVARRLDAHLRDSDMASRVGGDEFAVLLSEVTDAEGAMAAAGRLRRIFRKPFEVKGERHQLDARLGVALYPDHASDFDALLTAADHAMYQVRSVDREGVVLFDPEGTSFHP